MIGFIKDRNTFQTLDMMLDVSQYDLILGSTNNNVGTVQVPVELEGLENQFFIADDRMWVIKSLAPDKGKTIITLNDISWMFARDLLWDDTTTYSTIEECIADTIDTEYINLADTEYDTPYVRVSYSTATAWIKPDTENGLWNLKGYIAKVRRMKNVFLSFSISGNYLDIEIEQKTPTLWKLDFATDVAKMYQETYQKTATAKITVNGTTDYYMFTDGTYSTNPAAGTRIQGEWLQVQVNANEDETDKVEDIFSKNAESMILEFYTTEPVEFYDTVQLRHEGRVVTGTLSLVSISSSDNRRYCKTGDLINTVPEAISVLSERIEKVTKTVERATESQNIQGDFHVSGDIYEGGVKLEDKYGGKLVTLWTNPNPTATFAPQTITLSQSAGNFIVLIVEALYGNWGTPCKTSSIIFPSSGRQKLMSGQDNTGSGVGMRDITPNGTSVTFGQGHSNNASSESQSAALCIPQVIYGVKL
jgi:hypothetical protein